MRNYSDTPDTPPPTGSGGSAPLDSAGTAACASNSDHSAPCSAATDPQAAPEMVGKTTNIHARHASPAAQPLASQATTRHTVRNGPLARDPVQLYLNDVSHLPLLTLQQERTISRELAHARTIYLRTLTKSDFVLRGAQRIFTLIRDGQLRLDRTVNLWVVDETKKQLLKKLLEPGIKTLDDLLQRNGEDFRLVVNRQRDSAARQAAWQNILARRTEGVRLVAELDVRLKCFDPLLVQLVNICRKMLALKDEIDLFEGSGQPQQDQERRRRVHRLMRLTRESPKTLSRHVRRTLNARRTFLHARQRLAVGNLRLVVSVAKHYRRWGLSFQDLIQEGNIGLMRAVDKFDFRRGHKFSTYALWWIRQGITRALAEQVRTIRLPFHMHGSFKRIQGASHRYLVEHGREPTLGQLAQLTGLSVADTTCLMRLGHTPLSLDSPRKGDSSVDLSEILADSNMEDPLHHVARRSLKDDLDGALQNLTPREREVLQLRFGLKDGHSRSLVDVGEIMGVSRETVRLVEKQAFKVLRERPEVAPLLEMINLTDKLA